MKKGDPIRRRALILAILACCLFLCGCGETPLLFSATPSPVPSPTVPPTPEPSPTPAPVIAVFGADASAAFAGGLRSAAESGSYALEFFPGGSEALASFQPEGACAAVVLLDRAADPLPETSLPLFVFAPAGQAVPPQTPALSYRGEKAAGLALDFAVAYPPHETPVRLIGLFTSAQSEVYALWKAQAASGRVFPKAELFLSRPQEETPEPDENEPTPTPEPTLNERLTDLFSKFYPGMIDGVFAETGELAVAASEALASLGRDDMEVFSASTSANAAALLSPILVCAVGADYAEAGGLCYSAASALLEGGSIPATSLEPVEYAYSPEN